MSDFQKAAEMAERLVGETSKVIVDKQEQIKLILATWIAGGHVLLEDVPGTGKTVLAKTMAKLTQVSFSRIQFTPDLLPNDITGSSMYNQEKHSFEFLPGPLFSTFILADEINRATPRTQSALLESMGERQITSEGKTTPLPNLFFVMATQNPVEQHGTFPLPEAQLDRFSIKLTLGYPDEKHEVKLLKDRLTGDPLQKVAPLFQEEELQFFKNVQQKISVSDQVYQYTLSLIKETRRHPDLKLGASPRASLTLINTAKAWSLLRGEDFVKPSDIYDLSHYVLGHRLIMTDDALFANKNSKDILAEILDKIKTPTR